MSKTLLVMAGGTGGHVFPGIAVAEVLRARGWNIVWMGNPDGIEARLVAERPYTFAPVRFAALRGKGLARKLQLPFALYKAVRQARAEITRIAPDVVLGMGGYVSFPGGVAARLAGIPLVVHEQNSIAGLANRWLAKIARRVVTGFPDALPRGEWVGNPVRPEIAALAPPAERFRDRDGPLSLLVIGGSLGATALNETTPLGLALLPPEERPRVVHQAGEKHLDALRCAYADAGVDAECVAFIGDMAAAYADADLALCRAGALTVAELAASGTPSILVPYPFAVDDHQTANARFLTRVGGAFLLPQEKLTPEAISLIRNYRRGQLVQMAEKARELARPDAAAAVARACEEVVS